MNVDGVILSPTGALLVEAAAYIEQHGNLHPFRAIVMVAPNDAEAMLACRQLAAVCGFDYMDHDAEESIGDLVGAAFWDAEVRA